MTDKKLIFIVDDDKVISTTIVRRFTTEGYNIEAFSYGEECLKEMKRNPDLIILDYYFIKSGEDVMNGMQVFDRIKALSPDIPVIMLSAQEKGEIVLELARKGIDDYVIKDSSLIENLLLSVKEFFERQDGF